MPDFLKNLLASGLVKARVFKIINAASLAAGTWALTSTYVWITTHVAAISQTDAMAIAGTISAAVAGIILTGGSAIYDWIDAGTVHDKVVTAAATGSVAAANDPAVRQAVNDASGSPAALQEVLATLAAGKE